MTKPINGIAYQLLPVWVGLGVATLACCWLAAVLWLGRRADINLAHLTTDDVTPSNAEVEAATRFNAHADDTLSMLRGEPR